MNTLRTLRGFGSAAALLVAVVVFAAGCEPTMGEAEFTHEIVSTTNIADNREPRELFAPAPDSDGITRVLVYHDMEGLSGQDDWRSFIYSHSEQYAHGQEMLVADVNAVIDGLFAGGADEVHVVDAHGSGNPRPDILQDRLDPRAEQIFRDEPFRQYVDLVEPGVYDAIAAVGMHAKTGSGGFASHTYTLGMEIVMNEMPLTETELIGYSWGRAGVPVIFASGDDRLAQDLQTMPWLRT
ncbi:MAG TPA: M55 family metallopeptidase [Longimicrobiaceae bacterium]|nr:M55 family metallopeptidase [Longimicrobiaceae bacterium]